MSWFPPVYHGRPSGLPVHGRLGVRECGISVARVAVERLHRHLDPPVSGLQAFEVIGANGWPVGWAVVGRPGAPALQVAGWVEVTRCATDGTRNACSALYGACERWARRRGLPLVTYTMVTEGGGSLRGAGWVEVGRTNPIRSPHRNRPGRPRKIHKHDGIVKIRWIPGSLFYGLARAIAAAFVVRP